MKAPCDGLAASIRAELVLGQLEARGHRPDADGARQEDARLRTAADGRVPVEGPPDERRAAAGRAADDDVRLGAVPGAVAPAVLPDAGRPVAQLVRERHRASRLSAAESSQMVNGPSFTSSTAISAPKMPRSTRMPCAATASA